MPADVVIAANPFGLTEYRGVWPPSIPEKLDDRQDDRQGNPGYGAEDRYAGEADYR
jgi:hypothetical protein